MVFQKISIKPTKIVNYQEKFSNQKNSHAFPEKNNLYYALVIS